MGQLRMCASCGETGKHGAQFKLCVGSDESDVHKFCGQKLVEQAPEGVEVRLVHWTELRAEKREAKAKTEQSRVTDFWASKFAKAKARAAASNGTKAAPTS